MMVRPVVRITPASVFTWEMGWLRCVPLGDADHPDGDQAQQAAENKADERNHQQVRQPHVKELLGIDPPLVQQAPISRPSVNQPVLAANKKSKGYIPISSAFRLDCAQEAAGMLSHVHRHARTSIPSTPGTTQEVIP